MAEEQKTMISKNPLLEFEQNQSKKGNAVLIEIEGYDIGRSFKIITSMILIGRSEACDIVLASDSVSRKHAVIQKHNGDYIIFDNGSTNGLYVNYQKVKSQILKDSDTIRIGAYVFKFLESENVEAQYHEELYHLKNYDALTHIYNKRYFTSRLEYEFERVNRYGKPLSFISLDIDHFKLVNDNYGHLAGDFILSEFSRLISLQIRKTDIFGRVGGEEFSILAPETEKNGAIILAEKIRKMIEHNLFTYNKQNIPITTSLGVAAISDFDRTPTVTEFIAFADKLLYQAKQNGRNQVQF
ncbi:GGDEF domain-containing protein [bacterium]|nr:GGDEF domain-containing protein [bacterium]